MSEPTAPAPRRPSSNSWALVAVIAVASYLAAFLLAAFVGPNWFLPAPSAPQTPAGDAHLLVVDGAATFASVPGRTTVVLTVPATSSARSIRDAAPLRGGRLDLARIAAEMDSLPALRPGSFVVVSYKDEAGSRLSVLARLSEIPVVQQDTSSLTVQLVMLDAPGVAGPYTSGATADLPQSSRDVVLMFSAAN